VDTIPHAYAKALGNGHIVSFFFTLARKEPYGNTPSRHHQEVQGQE